MKVQAIMTEDVETCRTEDDLARAAMIMWERDCGSVPVTNGAGKVVGIITDRDICMAVTFKERAPAQIKAGEIISGIVYSCHPDDGVENALELMQHYQLRRLPVIGDGGILHGILSINDVILNAKRGDSKKRKHVSHKDVMTTLKALSEHRPFDFNQTEANDTEVTTPND